MFHRGGAVRSSGLGLTVPSNGRRLRAAYRLGQGAFFGPRAFRLGQSNWFRDRRVGLGQEGDLFDVGWVEAGAPTTDTFFTIPEMSFTPVESGALQWDWAARDAAAAAGAAPPVAPSTDWFGSAGNIFQTAFPAVLQAATTTLPLWLPMVTGQRLPAGATRPAPPPGYAYNPQGQLVRTTPSTTSWTPLLLLGGAAVVGGYFLLKR